MSSLYAPASRALQDRFDTRRLADRLEEVIMHDTSDYDIRPATTRQRSCASSGAPGRVPRISAFSRNVNVAPHCVQQ